ncbi:MAG: HEAT repeat domain-containing protein [bacterium]
MKRIRIKDKQTIEPLINSLKDNNPWIREKVVENLRVICNISLDGNYEDWQELIRKGEL